jgi:hypothetical protein
MMKNSSRENGSSLGLNTASFVAVLVINAVLFREETSRIFGVAPDPYRVFVLQLMAGMLVVGFSQSRRVTQVALWALAACVLDYVCGYAFSML